MKIILLLYQKVMMSKVEIERFENSLKCNKKLEKEMQIYKVFSALKNLFTK